jgi:hypothetical protein
MFFCKKFANVNDPLKFVDNFKFLSLSQESMAMFNFNHFDLKNNLKAKNKHKKTHNNIGYSTL